MQFEKHNILISKLTSEPFPAYHSCLNRALPILKCKDGECVNRSCSWKLFQSVCNELILKMFAGMDESTKCITIWLIFCNEYIYHMVHQWYKKIFEGHWATFLDV